MSYVEGIGDEVTILFTLFIGLVLLYVAWLSTSVSDQPLIRVIVLDYARFQEFLQRFTQRHSHTNAATPAVTVPPDHTTETTTLNTSESITDRSKQITSHPNTSTAIQSDGPPIETVSNIQDDDIIEAPHVTQSILDSFLSSTRTLTNQPESSDTTSNTTQEPSVSLPAESQDTTETNVSVTNISSITSISTESSPTKSSPTEGSPSIGSPAENSPTSSSQDATGTSISSTSVAAEVEEAELLDGHIRVRLKYLDERQRLVQAKPADTIGQFKRTHFPGELADNFSVRFIFRGQELREDRTTLEAYNIEDNSVIHCLLTRITQPPQANVQLQEHGQSFDMGFLMFPLFGVILALMWYSRFAYRHYFSAVSTLSLVGITFLFVVALMAIWRHDERREQAN